MKVQSWSKTWMSVCESLSLRSKDPNTKVGSVIVSPDNRRISVGYNGFATGAIEGDRWNNKYSHVIHAEINAIMNARQNIEGWTLYTTMFPCEGCRDCIIQQGISKVVYNSFKSVKDTYEISKNIFLENGVNIERFRDC
jgi:dCMP deaminase